MGSTPSGSVATAPAPQPRRDNPTIIGASAVAESRAFLDGTLKPKEPFSRFPKPKVTVMHRSKSVMDGWTLDIDTNKNYITLQADLTDIGTDTLAAVMAGAGISYYLSKQLETVANALDMVHAGSDSATTEAAAQALLLLSTAALTHRLRDGSYGSIRGLFVGDGPGTDGPVNELLRWAHATLSFAHAGTLEPFLKMVQKDETPARFNANCRGLLIITLALNNGDVDAAMRMLYEKQEGVIEEIQKCNVDQMHERINSIFKPAPKRP